MASISIKHIGPLTATGQVDLSRFNVIIGRQSSGKSTFMKILCFCQWLEKKIMVGDDKALIYNYTHYNRFLKELKNFHRFPDDYFSQQSEIIYNGEALKIELYGSRKNAQISRCADFNQIRHNTKLSYIPSERVLVSALRNVDKTYRSNQFDLLFNHVFEWDEAKVHYPEQHPVDLSVVGNMKYYYDRDKGVDVIYLNDKQKKVSPFYVSSGVQSVLPVVVMTQYFTDSISSDSAKLSKNEYLVLYHQLAQSSKDESTEISSLIDKVSERYKYQNTCLFIEEPEQNLFPESQQALVNFIVKSINEATLKTGNPSSVTITTHSPYVITAFNVLLKAALAEEKDAEATYRITPKNTIIPFKDMRAYYIAEGGEFSNILDDELQMIGGMELDSASDHVEDDLSSLNDVIYGGGEQEE